MASQPEDFNEREEQLIHEMFEVFRTLLPVPTEDFTERLFDRLGNLVEEERLQSPAWDDILVSLVIESVGMVTSWLPKLPDEVLGSDDLKRGEAREDEPSESEYEPSEEEREDTE